MTDAALPQVSYVLTLYNKAKYLPIVLAGLRAQVGDFIPEYIFVNDGSTDNTLEVLRELTSDWDGVKIIDQVNQGPAVAINAGFAAVTGDYVKPLDGDDLLSPNATRFMLQALEETGLSVVSTYAPCIGLYDPLGDVDELISMDAGELKYEVERNSLCHSLKKARMNPSCWMAKADLVKDTGGSDVRTFIQDYSMELRMALRSDMAFLHCTTFYAPREDVDRASGNEAQILHDINQVLVAFLQDNPTIPSKDKKYALRRAAGRAWAWDNRKNKASVFSKTYLAYLKSVLGVLPASGETSKIVCAPFKVKSSIRSGHKIH